MVRDVEDDKVDYSLVLDGPMFERWAVHLTKGAAKYTERNWMKAKTYAEYWRFKKSALRHFLQWFRGDTDEDHAAAVMFNINGAEYVAGENDSPWAHPEGTPEGQAVKMAAGVRVPAPEDKLPMHGFGT